MCVRAIQSAEIISDSILWHLVAHFREKTLEISSFTVRRLLLCKKCQLWIWFGSNNPAYYCSLMTLLKGLFKEQLHRGSNKWFWDILPDLSNCDRPVGFSRGWRKHPRITSSHPNRLIRRMGCLVWLGAALQSHFMTYIAELSPLGSNENQWKSMKVSYFQFFPPIVNFNWLSIS